MFRMSLFALVVAAVGCSAADLEPLPQAPHDAGLIALDAGADPVDAGLIALDASTSDGGVLRGLCSLFPATHFPFDEASGTEFVDRRGGPTASAQSLQGPLEEDSLHVNGMIGRAVSLDSTFLAVPHSPATSFGEGDFTFAVWIRTSDDDGVRVIADKRRTGSSGNNILGFVIFLFDGAVGVQLGTGMGSGICSPNPLSASCVNVVSSAVVSDGVWHHVAIVLDRSQDPIVSFWVDGTEAERTTLDDGWTGSITTSMPLRVGARVGADPRPIRADLDELAFFPAALEPAQMTRLLEGCD